MNKYGDLWYHPKAISNILSLSTVKKNNRIIYDSNNGYRLIVINTRPGGHKMIFTEKNYGLYYNDVCNTKGVSMLNTVEENLNHYNQ